MTAPGTTEQFSKEADHLGSAGSRLAHALVELARTPIPARGMLDVLTEISLICQAAFSEPAAVSISMGDPTAPTQLATASKFAQGLDGAQMVAHEGPCHDAWRDKTLVHTSDLGGDPRWPRLAERIAGSTVCAAVCAPITSGGAAVGALNVYSVFAELVDDAALETVELLAAAVAAVIEGAQVKHDLEVVAEQLRTALRSRATIDQAKGILMARHRCDADEAFRMLVETSTSTNVKLREVAERLVTETAQGR